MALILLVEDDRAVAAAVARTLTGAGHAVRPVGRAADALGALTEDPPDLVVLDLGLPDMDGAVALRMVRAVSDVPVVVATARRDEAEIVSLLDAGADDYVTKPFSGAHLLARVGAVLRRARAATSGPPADVVVGDLVISPGRREVSLAGEEVRLSRREFDLLAHLAGRVGQVVGRRELLAEVWGRWPVGEEQTVDVHLSWLRRKLGETAAAPRYLRTVRGVGVALVEPPVESR